MALTFDEALARLGAAGLWEEMLPLVEMEPLPAGALLFQDIDIDDAQAVQIGGDSSGGAYVRLSDGRILLASSEGEMGILGESLAAALANGVGVGGLYDAMRFMGGEDVEAARASWRAFRAQWNMSTRPAEDPAALEIIEVLDLTLPPDPFAALHGALRSTPPGLVRIRTEQFIRFGDGRLP
jgi:hypothetical protein